MVRVTFPWLLEGVCNFVFRFMRAWAHYRVRGLGDWLGAVGRGGEHVTTNESRVAVASLLLGVFFLPRRWVAEEPKAFKTGSAEGK